VTAPLRTPPGRFCLGIDTGGTFTDAVVCAYGTDGAASRVVASAKTPTTHHDLHGCVVEAMTRVLAGGDRPADDVPGAADIGLVAVSTTLATNALVEGAGRPAGLVAIGFEPDQLARVGLGAGVSSQGSGRMAASSGEGSRGAGSGQVNGNLASAPVVLVDGGHTAQGDMRSPLDLDELHRATERIDGSVDAYAVAAQFSVRNNSHELAARDAIRRLTGKPVTCSHELSPRLGGPRRAVTTLLNAQLISVTARFTEAIRAAMASLGLDAPLMVVRGDGSLVGADFVTLRPIETVLSGPAASVIGARHLALAAPEGGHDIDIDIDIDTACLIADVGGTTTDIAAIRDGVAVAGASDEDDTAVVAGHATMVTALPTTTVGLGGDSEIWIPADGGSGELAIGPRRVVPLCVAAKQYPDVVLGMLRRQLAADTPLAEFGQIVLDASPEGAGGSGDGSDDADGIDGEVLRLVRAAGGALPRSDLKRSARWRGALGRLERSGSLRRAALTPTDACVVLGLVDAESVGDADAALLGSELFCRQRDRYGVDVGAGAVELSRRVLQVVLRDAAEALLGVGLGADGIAPGETRRPLARAALDRRQRSLGRPAAAAPDAATPDGAAPDAAARSGPSPLWGLLDAGETAGVPVAGDVAPEQSTPVPLARIDAGAAVPIVMIGAPAVTYAPLIADLLGTVSVVPPYAAVANAVGAAVARIRITKQVTVTAPRRGSYRAHWGEDPPIWHSLSEAREWATARAVEAARTEATEAGALDPDITVEFQTRTAPSNGRELFVEATLRVTASGRPR